MSHLYHGYVSHNQMVDCLILELEAQRGCFPNFSATVNGCGFSKLTAFHSCAFFVIFLDLHSGNLQEPVSEISHLIDDIDEFH